ncbi:chitooligosaccharide deacetylase [candidate division KSB1 bacterium]|nr:MAG: chitooligosaccharide deacetylase [candidate division KSB1 bacterium]
MKLQQYSLLYKCVQIIFPWAICRVKNSPNRIYLTFDDGPHPQQTPQILDILRKYQIKASFFVLGFRSQENPHLLKQIIAAGHALGNHAYTHRRLWKCPIKEIEKEILLTEKIIRQHTGVRTSHFRPPYGFFCPTIKPVLEKHRYKLVLWNVLTEDYQGDYSTEKIVAQTLKATTPGSIVLLHDYNDKNNNTILVLPKLIQNLKASGFQFGTIYEI